MKEQSTNERREKEKNHIDVTASLVFVYACELKISKSKLFFIVIRIDVVTRTVYSL